MLGEIIKRTVAESQMLADTVGRSLDLLGVLGVDSARGPGTFFVKKPGVCSGPSDHIGCNTPDERSPQPSSH